MDIGGSGSFEEGMTRYFSKTDEAFGVMMMRWVDYMLPRVYIRGVWVVVWGGTSM